MTCFHQVFFFTRNTSYDMENHIGMQSLHRKRPIRLLGVHGEDNQGYLHAPYQVGVGALKLLYIRFLP